MTEEIIIDGIDVSKCEFYGYEALCKLYSGSVCPKDCNNYPNCYYKQLKRKEQECEKYKKGFEEDFAFNNELINDKLQIGLERNRYKQALDEIEQTISKSPSKGIQEILQTQMEYTQSLLSVSETKLQKILGIISKAKDNKQ